MKKTIEVTSHTTYGIKEGGDLYGFSKKSGLNKAMFRVGDTLDVDVVEWNGKNIITQANVVKNAKSVEAKKPEIVGDLPTVPAALLATSTAPLAPMKFGKPLSEYERQTELQIHLSGLKQALIGSPTLASWGLDKQSFIETVDELTGVFENQIKKRTGRQ